MFYLRLTTKFSQCTVKENKGRILKRHNEMNENAITWFLKLATENSSSINYNEFNVGKQSQIIT